MTSVSSTVSIFIKGFFLFVYSSWYCPRHSCVQCSSYKSRPCAHAFISLSLGSVATQGLASIRNSVPSCTLQNISRGPLRSTWPLAARWRMTSVQLYCRNGRQHLQILPDGTVQGQKDDTNVHSRMTPSLTLPIVTHACSIQRRTDTKAIPLFTA